MDVQWYMHAGYVLLLSSKTKQWAADFKLNSTATAVCFSPDSRYVLASSADADVYKFDIRSRRCVLRFFNEVRAQKNGDEYGIQYHMSCIYDDGWHMHASAS